MTQHDQTPVATTGLSGGYRRSMASAERMLQVVLDLPSRRRLESWADSGFPKRNLPAKNRCHHVTLYHPKSCSTAAPFDMLSDGERVIVHVVGRVTTSYVDAVVVVVEVPRRRWMLIHQGGGRRLLHVTIGSAGDVQPVASNDAIANNPVVPIPRPLRLRGVIRAVKA